VETLSLSRMKKFNPWIVGILLAGGLASAITVYLKTQTTSPQEDLTSQTVLVQTKDWVVQIQANGVVQAVQKINLSPEDSGRIAKLYVNEGDRVQKGQIIARMNSEKFQAQANQYQALLNKAVADLEQKLSGTREEEIAEAKARVVTAQASVAAAQTRVSRATAEMQRNQVLVQEGAILLAAGVSGTIGLIFGVAPSPTSGATRPHSCIKRYLNDY
jgi:HlyD family secretion protein